MVSELFREDSFLQQMLNPIFLNEIQNYWNTLKLGDAPVGQLEEIAKAKHNLLSFVFRRLFQPLYLTYPPLIKGSVFFLSCIYSDGLGDYFSLLKCAKIIKEHHPHLAVHIAYTFQQELPQVELSQYLLQESDVHPFLEKSPSFSHFLESILEGKSPLPIDQELAKLRQEVKLQQADYKAISAKQGRPLEALNELIGELEKKIQVLELLKENEVQAKRLYDEMQKSLAIVHIALALNTFENPKLASKSFYFSETGNFQGIANFLQLNWFSMGLLPFEEGIFLKKPSLSPQSPWKNQRLPKLLLKTFQPSETDFIHYFRTQSLHLGYLPKIPHQQKIFIYLICLQQQRDPRHIDIILPAKHKNDSLEFNVEWLSSSGITKVLAIDLDGDNETILFEKHSSSEKRLRLIYALPIPSDDFAKILGISGEIAGCTGDISISDCIIAGKIPFYELRRHKVETTESFQRLATYLELKDIYDYFTEMADFHNRSAERCCSLSLHYSSKNLFH